MSNATAAQAQAAVAAATKAAAANSQPTAVTTLNPSLPLSVTLLPGADAASSSSSSSASTGSSAAPGSVSPIMEGGDMSSFLPSLSGLPLGYPRPTTTSPSTSSSPATSSSAAYSTLPLPMLGSGVPYVPQKAPNTPGISPSPSATLPSNAMNLIQFPNSQTFFLYQPPTGGTPMLLSSQAGVGVGTGVVTPTKPERTIRRKKSKKKMKTPYQLRVLKSAYFLNGRPGREEVQELIEKTGLPHNEVTRWFRNERFKDKKRGEDPTGRSINFDEDEDTGSEDDSGNEGVGATIGGHGMNGLDDHTKADPSALVNPLLGMPNLPLPPLASGPGGVLTNNMDMDNGVDLTKPQRPASSRDPNQAMNAVLAAATAATKQPAGVSGSSPSVLSSSSSSTSSVSSTSVVPSSSDASQQLSGLPNLPFSFPTASGNVMLPTLPNSTTTIMTGAGMTARIKNWLQPFLEEFGKTGRQSALRELINCCKSEELRVANIVDGHRSDEVDSVVEIVRKWGEKAVRGSADDGRATKRRRVSSRSDDAEYLTRGMAIVFRDHPAALHRAAKLLNPHHSATNTLTKSATSMPMPLTLTPAPLADNKPGQWPLLDEATTQAAVAAAQAATAPPSAAHV